MEPLPKATTQPRWLQLALGAGLGLWLSALHAAPFEVWTTDRDGLMRLQRQADVPFTTQPAQGLVIEIHPEDRHQRFLGVGAALTDSSAWLLQHRLADGARAAVLEDLFSARLGIGLNMLRVTIGSSDFSQRHYSLDDTPDNEPDPSLRHYAEQPETLEVRALARQAHAVNPSLHVIASPWSAPAWMKTPAGLIAGRMQRQYHAAFAEYLLRFADAYANAGLPLYALTVQNEPAFEAPSYASMRFDADERARFIAEALGPRLRARAHAPKLLEWDHNWSMPGSPLAVLAHADAAQYIDGVAWHCYGGFPESQSWVHGVAAKDVYITECSGGDWQQEWPDGFRSLVGTVLIDGLRNGARAVLFWNLVLDEHHGPFVGGCKTCRGVVTLGDDGVIHRNAEYYALAHLSRFVRPGATVVGSTSTRDGVRSVALVSPDQRRLTVLLQNTTTEPQTVGLRLGRRTANVALAPGMVATVHGPL